MFELSELVYWIRILNNNSDLYLDVDSSTGLYKKLLSES